MNRAKVALSLQDGRITPLAGGGSGPEPQRIWGSGVRAVHVSDVDAARGGRPHWNLLSGLIARGLRVQHGGGIRSMTQVQQLIELGVDTVAVSTQALRHPAWAKELCTIFPRRIVLALDIQDGHALWDGRAAASPLTVTEALAQAGTMDLAGLVVQQVEDDGVVAPDRSLQVAARARPGTWLGVPWGNHTGHDGLDLVLHGVPLGNEVETFLARYPEPAILVGSRASLVNVGRAVGDADSDEDYAEGVVDDEAKLDD